MNICEASKLTNLSDSLGYCLLQITKDLLKLDSYLTHLCPGKYYWADFYNFLHMNPSDDQMKK